MKRFVLLIIVLVSCDFRYMYNQNIPDLELETPIQVMDWTRDNIRYKGDTGYMYPEDTYMFRYGNCAARSLFAVYILENQMSIDAKIMVGKRRNTGEWHAWVGVDGFWYDFHNEVFEATEWYKIVHSDIRSYTYGEIVAMYLRW